MNKNLLLVILLAFALNKGISQSWQNVDSYKQQLLLATNDTSRAYLMAALVFSYQYADPDSAFYYANRAIALSEKIKYPKGKVRAIGFEGNVYIGLGNLPKALEMAVKSMQIADSNKVVLDKAIPLAVLGFVYNELKDYPKALHYYHLMKSICETDTITEITGLAFSDLNIATVFEEMNQLDSASYYLNNAIYHFNKTAIGVYSSVYIVSGNIEVKNGHYDRAMAQYQQSLHSGLINSDHYNISLSYARIARLYQKLNNRDSSIYYAKKGLEEAEIISQKKTILESATLLSELYEQTDISEAFRYYKIATIVKDSLFGTNNIQAIQTMVAREEERQKEIEETKIAYQNQLKQYAFFAGFAILILIAAILYRNNIREKKAKKQLHEKNKVIEQTLSNLKSTQSQLIQSEKMASLGELTAGIAHEIQNPLNFVNNFSEVSNELMDEMKDEIMKGNYEEVTAIANDVIQNLEKINHHGKRADAIVKGMLQHSQTSTGKKEPANINSLADEYFRLAYHGLRAKDKDFNATLKTDFDESIGNINIIPQDIGRVLLNLYNNAFYAVGEKKKQQIEGYEPTVSVSTKKANGKIEVSVKDNGNGIPQKIVDKIFQPFFTTKPTGQGTGLGLSLSYDIIKAHGGEIKVETKEGEGTEFIIQLQVV
ncbi:MAG TPA: ATP-binding protein [Panacibacter sp.]|nr:ATP-binding protein [Panacibacter sp.]